jgi:hypothetical protein
MSPSVDLLFESLRDFCCCRGNSVTLCRTLHGRGRLAYNEMLSFILRAQFASLLPECHAGLDIVAHRTFRHHHP